MRRLLASSCLAFSVLLLASTAARAQFQPPTPDELKMTADPTYPDAAAVILNYEQKTDDVIHFTSTYRRIKILKDSARDLATVHLGYLGGGMEVAAIQGRTIQPDGSVVPLTVKPADLMQTKQGTQEYHDVVVNLPAVQVGSIIEVYHQIRYGEKNGGYENRSLGGCSAPEWDVQGDYPVRSARYTFTPCAGVLDNTPGVGGFGIIDDHQQMLTDLLWYTHLPGGKALPRPATGRFELTLNDIPPLPHEPWMPPSDSQRYQVRFYWGHGSTSAAYWNAEAKYWIKDVDTFASPGGLKDAVVQIAPPTDPPIDRAKKLYAAVQQLDNTSYSREKGKAELKAAGFRQAKRAEDTWSQKSGSPEDLALLYLAMLRAAGLTAYPMKVVDRQRGLFNSSYLNFNQLNDTVVILNVDGKDTVLDPGEKMCPFGLVSWRHSGAGGVRQTDKGADGWITPLLAYADNTVTRRADLTVSPDGSITGKLHLTLTGQDALRWRQQALREDESALMREFDEWLKTQVPNGVDAHVNRFAKLDDESVPLEAYAASTGNPGASTGKRLLLPASFFAFNEDRRFTEQPHRQLPVDMHYETQVKDGVLYHLPAGFTLETPPPATSIPWPQHAIYTLKAVNGTTGLTVMNSLTRAFTFVQPEDYPALRDFYQKLAAADQQQIVLTQTQASN